ncbi:MAG: acyltransferase [Caldimonas sp.]
MATASPPRDAAIDLLRGVAIALVMLLHFSLTYRLSQSPLADWFGRDAVRALIVNGNYGVTMFFVVSGFLITRNVLRRDGSLGAVDLRRFYVMRAARILPPLLLALAIIVPPGLAGVASFANISDGHALALAFWLPAVGSVLSFTHNMLMESAGYFNYCLNIYWSLSVEEVFYLGFPLLCLLVRRPPIIVAACAAAIAIGPIYRSVHADDELFFMYGYAACFDAIAFGCVAALAAQRPRRAPQATWRALSVLGALALAVVYLRGIAGHEVFGFSSVALAAALIVFASSSAATGHGGPARAWAAAAAFAPLRWAGRHSYELYLFHIVVLAALREWVPRDQLGYALKLPWLVAFVALSAALAASVARFVSEPCNAALRRRFLGPDTLARGSTRDVRMPSRPARDDSAG